MSHFHAKKVQLGAQYCQAVVHWVSESGKKKSGKRHSFSFEISFYFKPNLKLSTHHLPEVLNRLIII
jgi:hypothetical protein